MGLTQSESNPKDLDVAHNTGTVITNKRSALDSSSFMPTVFGGSLPALAPAQPVSSSLDHLDQIELPHKTQRMNSFSTNSTVNPPPQPTTKQTDTGEVENADAGPSEDNVALGVSPDTIGTLSYPDIEVDSNVCMTCLEAQKANADSRTKRQDDWDIDSALGSAPA